jgi:hypothetical protein
MTVAEGTGNNDLGGTPVWLPGEARLDRRLIQARIERERDEARLRARIAERQAAARLRQEATEARRATRDEARKDRAARRAAAAAWCQARTVDLLFVPVVAVPGLLSWTGMASYGQSEFGPPGLALPALSEGGMWAFAAATTITRRKSPDKPVWHLRLGTLTFAAYGAALNFLHGLSRGGPLTGASMALISVAGVTAHQLITAGPRRTLAEREQSRIHRSIARRERAARRAAIRSACFELDGAGHARLVFEAGTAILSRSRLNRRRLDFDDNGALALDAAPVRTPDPGPAQAVPVPASVYEQDSVRPPCTGDDAEQITAQAARGRAEEQPEASVTGSSREDAANWREQPVDRSAVVAEIADQIRDAVRAGDVWRPDYEAMMAATGRRRSWCEKVVRAARNAVLEVPARTDNHDCTE